MQEYDFHLMYHSIIVLHYLDSHLIDKNQQIVNFLYTT